MTKKELPLPFRPLQVCPDLPKGQNPLEDALLAMSNLEDRWGRFGIEPAKPVLVEELLITHCFACGDNRS